MTLLNSRATEVISHVTRLTPCKPPSFQGYNTLLMQSGIGAGGKLISEVWLCQVMKRHSVPTLDLNALVPPLRRDLHRVRAV